MNQNLFLYLIIIILLPFIKKVYLRDPPTVNIPNQGTIMGIYLKMYRIQSVVAYLGIPYAQPPINEKRFAPPVLDTLPTWQGIRNATTYMPDCWQNSKRILKKHDEIFMKLLEKVHPKNGTQQFDEDCLFLNIFIPDAPAPMEGYSVIAWLHSGDFSYGSTQDLDPLQMVFKQKVIVVTISYRLNIFGFLSTMDGESPGNFGLMDQSAALHWIKRNIKLFNGNENSITLMGHGAGGISAGIHLISGDWSNGVFHKVIIMSGSLLADTAVKNPLEYSSALDAIANSFGCFRRPTSKLIECLRYNDAKTLSENLPAVEWGPVIDFQLSNTTSPFIMDKPIILISKGHLQKVPLLIGFTDMEEVLDVLTPEMIKSGISNEMYETLINDIIINELVALETNDTCGGNMNMVLDAVQFAYKPPASLTNTSLLRHRFIDFYTQRNYLTPAIMLAEMMSKQTTVYLYRFDMKVKSQIARKDIAEWIGVPHNFDLIFVWGIPYWSYEDAINRWESVDKRISDIIMVLWANFAKFSNPTHFGVYIKWNNYSDESKQILIIDRSFNMSDDTSLNLKSVQFWGDYYPKVVQHAALCCNVTEDKAISLKHNSVALIIITLGFLGLT